MEIENLKALVYGDGGLNDYQKELAQNEFEAIQIKINNMFEEINYKDVIDLGFKSKKMKDQMHIDMHGFDDIDVKLKLTKYIYIDWSVFSHETHLIRIDNKENMNILSKFEIKTLPDLKAIINIFKPVRQNVTYA